MVEVPAVDYGVVATCEKMPRRRGVELQRSNGTLVVRLSAERSVKITAIPKAHTTVISAGDQQFRPSWVRL